MTVKKSFALFAAIAAAAVAALFFFSVDAKTLDALKNARPAFLLCAVLLVALGWLLDAFKFILIAKAAGEKISFRVAVSVVWINYFGCAVTPMQSGGGPFQIYLLYREGVSVGKSVAITLVRTLQILFLLALAVPLAFMADGAIFWEYGYLRWYICYVGAFVMIIASLLVVSVLRPSLIKRVTGTLLVRIKRIGILKAEYLTRAIRWVNREIDAYAANIKLFATTGKTQFLASTLLAAAHQLVYLSVMPCVIKAVGFGVDYAQCLLAEALFIFMLYFAPTPGASGAAEGGAAVVMGLFVPWNIAGVAAVLWRLISEYSGIAVGAFIIIKTLGWAGADKVLKAEEEAENTGVAKP